MKMMPLQLVIIDLENGQRGVFIGRPLIIEDIGENDHQVQNVWFTDIQEMPDSATLEQLTRMTLEQMSQGRTLQLAAGRRPARVARFSGAATLVAARARVSPRIHLPIPGSLRPCAFCRKTAPAFPALPP